MSEEGDLDTCAVSDCGYPIRFQDDGWLHMPGGWDFVDLDLDLWIDAADESYVYKHAAIPGGTRILHDDLAEEAMFLGMCVRNAMEDFHASEDGPTDKQMAVINRIVRDGIATGLHVLRHERIDSRAQAYAAFERFLIPDYWERPRLLDSYLKLRGRA